MADQHDDIDDQTLSLENKPNGSKLKHHSNAKRPYTCQICSKGFLSLTDLKRHSNSHTGECGLDVLTFSSQHDSQS